MAAAGPVFAIFDERIRAIAAKEEEFREMMAMGGARRADSAEALARLIGVDPVSLADTLAAYNAAASGLAVTVGVQSTTQIPRSEHARQPDPAQRGEQSHSDEGGAAEERIGAATSARTQHQSTASDPFGRNDFGVAPLAPPLYATRVVPGLFHTQGGLRVDEQTRVVRPDGTAIPNLFAGGGAAAGISGRSGGAGYASGNGLLTALGLGRIAGRTAAAEIGSQR